jgi:hypothetical protein
MRLDAAMPRCAMQRRAGVRPGYENSGSPRPIYCARFTAFLEIVLASTTSSSIDISRAEGDQNRAPRHLIAAMLMRVALRSITRSRRPTAYSRASPRPDLISVVPCSRKAIYEIPASWRAATGPTKRRIVRRRRRR